MNYDISTLAIPDRSNFLHISSRPGFASIQPSGEIDSFIERIRRMEIRTVMVLMPEHELVAAYGRNLLDDYRSAGFEVIHCPIEDFSVPRKIEGEGGCIEYIEKLWKALGEGHALVHCAAGLGRSGLVAACLLVRAGQSADQAVQRVRSSRPGTLQTLEQENFVQSFEGSLRKRS
jgi:hypothetical protein